MRILSVQEEALENWLEAQEEAGIDCTPVRDVCFFYQLLITELRTEARTLSGMLACAAHDNEAMELGIRMGLSQARQMITEKRAEYVRLGELTEDRPFVLHPYSKVAASLESVGDSIVQWCPIPPVVSQTRLERANALLGRVLAVLTAPVSRRPAASAGAGETAVLFVSAFEGDIRDHLEECRPPKPSLPTEAPNE